VYCDTIKDTTQLSEFLEKNGINSQPYHGSMTPKQREKIHKMFIKGREKEGEEKE
jgi:superfamily II DNA helicase RecQ